MIADDAGHPGHVPGRLEHLDRSQQRLARHARPVRALAAEQFVLDDHRGAVAALDRVLRGDLAGRPAADDDHVVGVTFRRYRFGLGHGSHGSGLTPTSRAGACAIAAMPIAQGGQWVGPGMVSMPSIALVNSMASSSMNARGLNDGSAITPCTRRRCIPKLPAS